MLILLPSSAAADSFADDLSEGLYLERRGDYAGAYLKYLDAAPLSPEAQERAARLLDSAERRMTPVYQVLPFLSDPEPAAGLRLAALLQARLAAAPGTAAALRAAALDKLPQVGLKGPSKPGSIKYLPGVNRLIVGEILKLEVRSKRRKEERFREVKEPFETIRYQTEEYQEEVEITEADMTLEERLAASVEAAAAKKKKSKKGDPPPAPRKKTVTRTREVPVTVTEYKVKYEPYSETVIKKSVDISGALGVVNLATGALEYRRIRRATLDSFGKGAKAETDAALKARAVARLAETLAADAAAEMRTAAAFSESRVKQLAAAGRQADAAEEALRHLAGGRRSPPAMKTLRAMAAENVKTAAPTGPTRARKGLLPRLKDYLFGESQPAGAGEEAVPPGPGAAAEQAEKPAPTAAPDETEEKTAREAVIAGEEPPSVAEGGAAESSQAEVRRIVAAEEEGGEPSEEQPEEQAPPGY